MVVSHASCRTGHSVLADLRYLDLAQCVGYDALHTAVLGEAYLSVLSGLPPSHVRSGADVGKEGHKVVHGYRGLCFVGAVRRRGFICGAQQRRRGPCWMCCGL